MMVQLTKTVGRRWLVSLAGSPNGVSVGKRWRPIHAIHRVKVIQAAGLGTDRAGPAQQGADVTTGGLIDEKE